MNSHYFYVTTQIELYFQYRCAVGLLQVHIDLKSVCNKIHLDCQDVAFSGASIVYSAQSLMRAMAS